MENAEASQAISYPTLDDLTINSSHKVRMLGDHASEQSTFKVGKPLNFVSDLHHLYTSKNTQSNPKKDRQVQSY